VFLAEELPPRVFAIAFGLKEIERVIVSVEEDEVKKRELQRF